MIAYKRVTAAELLALNGTPIEIIPTPGVGKVIVPVQWYARTINSTTGYTIAGQVYFALHQALLGGGDPLKNVLQNGGNSQSTQGDLVADTVSVTFQDFADFPLTLNADTANPILGDADLDVWVVYQVADLPS